jgi:two-component system, OmpR family, KDP operon response regulator KdpE
VINLQTSRQMNEKENKKTVLVVDDQPKLLKFIEIDLKLRGFTVVTTSSGEEALQLVNVKNPDIILLDMIMPGMDGFEVLKKLRAYSNLPVIAFSASPGNQDLALNAGANEFMHKPFDPDDMARKIKALTR